MSSVVQVFRDDMIADRPTYWVILDCDHWYHWTADNPPKQNDEDFPCPNCGPKPILATVEPVAVPAPRRRANQFATDAIGRCSDMIVKVESDLPASEFATLLVCLLMDVRRLIETDLEYPRHHPDPTPAPRRREGQEEEPLFRVWDRQRECWAGDGDQPNTRDLQDYALDEFKDAKLVYCDMEGWSIADCGEIYLHDECGNSVCADPARFEIRWNPSFLAAHGHASAERWRERALKAEALLPSRDVPDVSAQPSREEQ